MKKSIQEQLEFLDKEEARLKALNPFWYYEPSDGYVGEAGQELLREFLKEEDIPQVFVGQRDLHVCDADIRGVFGGNQSGKSVCGAIEAYIWATGEVPDALKGIYPESLIPKEFPQHIRVEGVDWKTFSANLLPTYQYWAPKEYLVGNSWGKSYSSEHRMLSLGKKGVLRGTIEFMTNQQDVESHQGPPRHGVIYDEEPRYEIYQENLMRFTTAERIKILFCMTPTKGLSWVYDEILLKSETDAGFSIECFALSTVTNKRANLDVVRGILSSLAGNYETMKMRLLGAFISLSGLVYGGLFNRGLHLIEPFEVTHNEYTVYRGIDPHLVTPTTCVEVAVDREGFEYVIGVYVGSGDTEQIKKDLAKRAKDRNYRLGWTMCDKSADSTIHVLGDRNIFLELARGDNAIPALFTSNKFQGSIHAGVDEIKKLLKIDEAIGRPGLFFFNTPENQPIIKAMQTMERDRAYDEERKGVRDKIAEGRHHAHAGLRYIHQRPVRWLPPEEYVPEYIPANEAIGY